jgi:ABC-type dipeptide/oligopeptide/nickel transport system ATPase component
MYQGESGDGKSLISLEVADLVVEPAFGIEPKTC